MMTPSMSKINAAGFNLIPPKEISASIIAEISEARLEDEIHEEQEAEAVAQGMQLTRAAVHELQERISRETERTESGKEVL